MANDWIIDVIADLRTYANTNGLSVLGNQLDDAMLIAATEIASKRGGAPETVIWEVGKTGRVSRTLATIERA